MSRSHHRGESFRKNFLIGTVQPVQLSLPELSLKIGRMRSRLRAWYWYTLAGLACWITRRAVLQVATITEERVDEQGWCVRMDTDDAQEAERRYRRYREARDAHADRAEALTHARSGR